MNTGVWVSIYFGGGVYEGGYSADFLYTTFLHCSSKLFPDVDMSNNIHFFVYHDSVSFVIEGRVISILIFGQFYDNVGVIIRCYAATCVAIVNGYMNGFRYHFVYVNHVTFFLGNVIVE